MNMTHPDILKMERDGYLYEPDTEYETEEDWEEGLADAGNDETQ